MHRHEQHCCPALPRFEWRFGHARAKCNNGGMVQRFHATTQPINCERPLMHAAWLFPRLRSSIRDGCLVRTKQYWPLVLFWWPTVVKCWWSMEYRIEWTRCPSDDNNPNNGHIANQHSSSRWTKRGSFSLVFARNEERVHKCQLLQFC